MPIHIIIKKNFTLLGFVPKKDTHGHNFFMSMGVYIYEKTAKTEKWLEIIKKY